MRKRSITAWLAWLFLMANTTNTSAAVVTYTLLINDDQRGATVSREEVGPLAFTLISQRGPGHFALVAQASEGDNQDIVNYSASFNHVRRDLDGSPLLEHASPLALSDLSQPVEFSVLQGILDLPWSLSLGAAQNTITPTPHIVFGFGQTGGALLDDVLATGGNGLLPNLPPNLLSQPHYESPLLLVMGQWNPLGPIPDFIRNSADNTVSVFSNEVNPDLPSLPDPDVLEFAQLQFSVQFVPEPSTLIALGSLALALGGQRQTY